MSELEEMLCSCDEDSGRHRETCAVVSRDVIRAMEERIEALLADNARLRSEIVRSHTALHGEMSSVGSGECECEWCKETR